MASTIGKVSAVFSASTSGLKAGISDASSSFKKLAGDVAGLRSGMRLLNATQGAQLFGQIASTASRAAQSLAAFGQQQAGVVDATRNLATRLGMTYGEFAGIAYAANLADVSMQSVGNAAQKAEIAFAKAASGSAPATAAFGALGLSVDELSGMNPAQRFQAIAAALASIPNSAERARLAVAILGKSGGELLPMFEGGAAGIAEAAAEAERFGLALTNQQSTAIDNMGDAFQKAEQAVAGVVQQVVAYLAPALEAITTTFTDLIGGIGGANIGQFIGDGIIAGAEFLAWIGDSIIAGLTSVWEFVSSIGVQWSAVFDLGNRVAAFFSGVGNSLKFVLAAGVLGLTSSLTNLAKLASYLASLVGQKSEFVDGMIASADAFNNSLVGSMNEAADAAGKDFARAFGESAPAAVAQKGPLASMLADAAKAARDNMRATDAPTKPFVKPAAEATFTGTSSEALKATDSRSKEGIAEMFRIMRGGGNDVQERQLEMLGKIHDDLSESDVEETAVFAGA